MNKLHLVQAALADFGINLKDFGINLEANEDFLWLSHAQHDSNVELAYKDRDGYLRRIDVRPKAEVKELPTFVVGSKLIVYAASGNMYLAPDRAYLRAERLEPYIELAQAVPNILKSLGLEDLPQALRALAGLGHGETGVFNNTYSLACGNNVYALRRGAIIDLKLDGKLMLSERVSFVTPSRKAATAYIHPMHFWDCEAWMEITIGGETQKGCFNMLEGSATLA